MDERTERGERSGEGERAAKGERAAQAARARGDRAGGASGERAPAHGGGASGERAPERGGGASLEGVPAGGGAIALPDHGSCYICGRDNPGGLGITFFIEKGRVKCAFRLDVRQQGPPGHAHGGCLSAILDEAMGAAVWCAGHPVVAARLEIDFRKAVPLGEALAAEAWVTSVSGRKIWAESEIRLADGTPATRGKGLFVEARRFFETDHYVPRL